MTEDLASGSMSFRWPVFIACVIAFLIFYPLIGVLLAGYCRRYKISLWIVSALYSIGCLCSGFIACYPLYQAMNASQGIIDMDLSGYVALALILSLPFVLMQLGMTVVLATGKVEKAEKTGVGQYVFYIAYPLIAMAIAAVVGKFKSAGADWMLYIMAMAICMAAVCSVYAWSRGFGVIRGLIAFVLSVFMCVLGICVLNLIYFLDYSILPLFVFIAILAIAFYAMSTGIFALFGRRKIIENDEKTS